MPTVDAKDKDNNITITLDGDTGKISAGGKGHDSALTLEDKKGKQRIYVDSDGNISVGGNGVAGNLQFYPANATIPGTTAATGIPVIPVAVIALLAATGELIFQTSGKKLIHLDGVHANLWLGGNGENGDVLLFAASGDNKTLGKATVALDGKNGNIRAGGPGLDGDVAVFSSDVKEADTADYGKARIQLVGGAGNIVLREKDGKEIVRLNPEPPGDNISVQDAKGKVLFAFNSGAFNNTRAGLFLGADAVQGGKLPGVMALRNDAGNDSIFLDGSTGDITLSNADCAEEFDIAEAEDVAPGAVMVIDEEGKLRESKRSYDKRVAGVLSGAGDFKPGIVLDKTDSRRRRMPVALVGKVYCNADAQFSPIEVGDLLTTSPTPGHAMKATDPLRAFGAVIGKALRPLREGTGLIPILIALQ